ncbi:MAG: hypothetical protein A2857_06840 [Candidatus Levybacteria bacterium RIFCSPHIGHO2_01_FULL_36_15]|nr:MAG: hypothetical protein A2857_06840 [Candidatus Levybacteria bacterium RIFCSPHIGHO2_01_FULL_36_15]OGH37810.1 MAG: hypothetical protein A2905_00165 [Candidatus Levybacteria bacterium RIFCSPLOWO2_01_FULL_36_10]
MKAFINRYILSIFLKPIYFFSSSKFNHTGLNKPDVSDNLLASSSPQSANWRSEPYVNSQSHPLTNPAVNEKRKSNVKHFLLFKLITKKFLLSILAVLLLLSSFLAGRMSALNGFIGTNVLSFGVSDNRVQIPGPKSKQQINKEFAFSIKSINGQDLTIKYSIESVEIQDEIVVRGQIARAVKGKTFLIVNLKLKNGSNQNFQVNARDYVRLSSNNKNDWFAADIHNDPVEIQAISTKDTRLGFPINDNDKNLRLKIGEIAKGKTILNLNK